MNVHPSFFGPSEFTDVIFDCLFNDLGNLFGVTRTHFDKIEEGVGSIYQRRKMTSRVESIRVGSRPRKKIMELNKKERERVRESQRSKGFARSSISKGVSKKISLRRRKKTPYFHPQFFSKPETLPHTIQ